MRRLGIPSFVVTLAFFLGLQGITLKLIGEGGSVRVRDDVIAASPSNVPVDRRAGSLRALIVVGYAALSPAAAPHAGRARACSTRRSAWSWSRIVVVAVGAARP